MEQNHIQSPDKKTNPFAFFSLAVGIFALFACVSPPMQLLLGASALMAAYFSKNGRPMTGPAIAGTIMGICGILSSFVFLAFYIFTIRMFNDPNYVAMHRELMRQYQDMMNAFTIK
ncbi:MAG: hypothetical protein HFG56_05955 [Lachnospiraceae bacterium]|nr:hypothetical protein [Lachnospiraceae bacterium]MCI9282820.1 hypothetical protein [Lachnospiraceae bacterium]